MSEVRVVGVYDAELVSGESALVCEDESLTHQEFASESDINNIIGAFGIGENPLEPQRWVTDVDITDAPGSFQDILNQWNVAARQFADLPARVRSRFDNDPAEFVKFVSDEANMPEMVELGLAVRRPDPVISDTDRLIGAIDKLAPKEPAQSSS